MLYKLHINLVNVRFMLHMSTQVGKGQSPLYFVYKQLPTSNVSAGADSHEAHFEIRWDRNRFRLTETIYMKLKHYYIRNNAFVSY